LDFDALIERLRSGWWEASALVVAIGALSLAYAVGNALGAHPIAFILYAMLVSAGGTLAITGVGEHARAIAATPMSWIVGAAIILIEVFYYVTLAYVPPAHGNLVLRIGIPIALLAGFLLLDRRPAPLAVMGGGIIVVATAYVVAITHHAVRWPMAVAGGLAGMFMVVRGLAGEFHAWNRAARTVQSKLRVTGILLLVTTFLSLALVGLTAVAVAIDVLPPLRFLPSAAQMLHVPTILLGVLVGGPILAMMNYLNLSSVVKITTENLTAIMVFSPATTWAFQEFGVATGLIVAARPEPRLIGAMVAMIAAVLLIFWAGRDGSDAVAPADR
jgi:hypothetical protein